MMPAFDPNANPERCAAYLSRWLQRPVRLLRASQLTQSTRAAPWRLDVLVGDLERSYVLQVDARGLEYEYNMLKAVELTPIPAPHAYGMDLKGEALGLPCFFSDFMSGEPLLKFLLAGESWAENVYLDAVCLLHSVTETDLGEAASQVNQQPVEDVLTETCAYFDERPHALAEKMMEKLIFEKPVFPPLRFSNGDLWLENFLVQDEKLTGVIDFQGAAFSDPVFEFLLSFFVEPGLQGRGIEGRYCQRLGLDPAILRWYHGLELFETWQWTLETGKSFVQHTTDSLETEIIAWLAA